jgi:hypothetical protein
MTKREITLLAVACTFIGVVVGFLLAPIKKGQIIYCGNHNGNDSANGNACKTNGQIDKKES